MPDSVEISHTHEISFEDVIAVARGKQVTVPDDTYSLLDTRRAQITNYIKATEQPAYGFNRGFGSNVHLKVEKEDLRSLQENLIRSHACCLGEPAPIDVVRATMFLRAKSLALGHSAVRSGIVRQLIDALNRGFVPVVPSFGSVSASGDLAPLSHIALSLFLGEGSAYVSSGESACELLPSADALARLGMQPIALDMKEGLALNNGVQYSTALCALATDKVLQILKTAVIATALSAQVMLGADTPFRKDLHALRKHVGSQVIADCIFELMKGSPLREAHLDYEIDGEIQDPYNLRCAAQILGPCLELVWRAVNTVTVEANSVTDNPIILKADRHSTIKDKTYRNQYVEIVSGGHFHGMPIAVEAYGVIQAASIMARLSNMRCVRFVDTDRNKGLGADLKWPGRIPPRHLWKDRYSEDDEKHQSMQSAMMMPEYVSAGLTNWIWGQAMPNHLFSLSTDCGQEDHVSMAANVALKAYQLAPRLAEVIAIELAYAAQAAAIRKHAPVIPSRAPRHDAEAGGVKEWHEIEHEDDRKLSQVSERMLDAIGQSFKTVKAADRSLAPDIRDLAAAVERGDFVRTAEQEADFFKEFWNKRNAG